MRVNRAAVLILAGSVICGAAAGLAGTGDPEFRSAGSRQNTILQDPCPASDFPPIQIGFASVIDERLPGTNTSIRCVTEVRNEGDPQRGVSIMLGGELLTGDGDPIRSLPNRSGSTNRAGQKTFTFPYSPSPGGDDLVAIIEGLLEGEEEIDQVDTTCGIVQRTPCVNSKTQACLLGNRFKVEVDWSSSNNSGQGHVIKATKTDALFYFISQTSPDMAVSMLQRCTANSHFWVFAAATTNVEYELTVTDTVSGESRSYDQNALGGMGASISDISAFATCP